MDKELKYYLVVNKPDDYNNCRQELVRTTQENAEQYYANKAVEDKDVEVLKKYIDFIDYEDEKDRDEEGRFY